MKWTLVAALAVLAVATGAQASRPDPVTEIITYQGVVSNGYAQAETFGGITDLTGVSFVATAYVDTRFGSFSNSGYGDVYKDNGDTFPVSISMTINGQTINFQNFAQSVAAYLGDFTAPQLNVVAGGASNNMLLFTQAGPATLPTSASQIFSVSGSQISSYQSQFYYNGGLARGELSITSISSAVLSGASVPEPATWALLVVGFGIVGGAMRQRCILGRTRVSPISL
jgi:hypothetical protein